MSHNHTNMWPKEFNDDEEDIISNVPKYIDGCKHGINSFVGSVQYYDLREIKLKWIDVYVFDQNNRQHVCIRTGNEPEDYLSPGTVLDVLISGSKYNSLEVYKITAALIDLKFKVRFDKI